MNAKAKPYMEAGIDADRMSMYTWQQSGFAQSGGPIRRTSRGQVAPEPAEPDCEPDVDEIDPDEDQFQAILAPARQMSIMSNFSAKPPSRQVTAMSNFSEQDWDQPVGFKRQQTDEYWPTWNGKDLPKDNEQHDQTVVQSLTNLMTPYPSADNNDMRQLYASQLVSQTKEDSCDQFQFRRKRESLIDLAKQQQEKGSGKDAPKNAGVKFCPFCGGNVQPSFKFCVFCGSGIPQCS